MPNGVATNSTVTYLYLQPTPQFPLPLQIVLAAQAVSASTGQILFTINSVSWGPYSMIAGGEPSGDTTYFAPNEDLQVNIGLAQIPNPPTVATLALDIQVNYATSSMNITGSVAGSLGSADLGALPTAPAISIPQKS